MVRRGDSLVIVQSVFNMNVVCVQWLIVLLGIASVGWGFPETSSYANSGPDPRKAYDFTFQTPTQGRREAADSFGDVRGRYHYTDDLGIQRTVDYMAGKNTGFVVTNETPDPSPANEASFYRASKPGAAFGTYSGTRGYLSSKLNADGTYNFKHSSPHQSHTEMKDAYGRVQGEYSFYDNEGKLHFVQYEAGPGIGYRVLKTSDGKPTPTKVFPTNSYGQSSYIQSRLGRSPDAKDELDTSEYYTGSKIFSKMSEAAVKIRNHGHNTNQDVRDTATEKTVRISWSPHTKKEKEDGSTFFKLPAEEYERAPDIDAVDYFIDNEEDKEKEFGMKLQRGEKNRFIINVPDPISPSQKQSSIFPLLPLSPREQDEINNLKDYSQKEAKNNFENVSPRAQKDRPTWNFPEKYENIASATRSASSRWY